MDDDVETRTMVAQALADEGLTVDEACDAHDALAIVGYAPPDVLVYHLGWGAGLHALDDLERSIVERGHRRPAIVLSTPSWVRARRGITLRGRVGVHELIAAIERAVRES
ncbi:MAG TPA: hypothetical protein VIL20_28140 [Sandaracinaceae bacterium]